MYRSIVLLLLLVAVSGCAQDLPDSARISVYQGQPASEVAVGITDHRIFILNNDKKEWFEGIVRGTFGIPMSLHRPGPDGEKALAVYLSEMIEESLENAGRNVTVVALEKGQDAARAIEKVTASGATGLIMVMRKSRYDVGFTSDYQYDFVVYVTDGTGKIKIEKTFAEFEKEIPASTKYNVFDMHTEIYNMTFDKILNDPEIKQALAGG